MLQLSFLPLLAWAIGRSLWRVRQERNYPVVGLLLLLTLGRRPGPARPVRGQRRLATACSIAALWLIAGDDEPDRRAGDPVLHQRGPRPSAAGVSAESPWLDNGILLG
ncbi:hypothetical protein P4234_13845 [Pseudomonas aeruginosa]|nr:hypothetical protein [Pseudomonas aeruginosa]